MSDEPAPNEDTAAAPATPGGRFGALPWPQLAMGGTLVAINAIVAGVVFSSLNRVEGEIARQKELEAEIQAIEEEKATAAEGPDVDLEVEELGEPSAPEEARAGEASEHSDDVAQKLGHAELSARLLGEYLLRMDAKGTTPGGIALVLADHGDLDRQAAKTPRPADTYETTADLDERLLVELHPQAGRTGITLRARARTRPVLEALAAQLGLTLRLNPSIPSDLPNHPLVVELRERPLPRVLGALGRALNVTFAMGDELLEVLPGPSTPEALRARALESYRWVLEDFAKTPAASRVYLSLAVLREEEQDHAGMVQTLRELILTWPESRAAAAGRLRLGQALLGRETAHARRYLFELMGEPLAPRSERAQAGLLIARSYMTDGDLTGARRSLEFSAELSGESEAELTERAKAYLALLHVESGEHEEAVSKAKPLLDAIDDEARRVAAEAKSRAELALGNPGNAAASAARWVAASLPNQRSRALGTLARSLEAAGRPVSAAAVYKLIRIEGGEGAWTFVVGESRLLTQIGRWEEAERILTHALEQAAHSADSNQILALRLELARVGLELKGPSQAKPILAAVALDPHTHPDLRASAYELLARVALQQGEGEEALALYTALAGDKLAPIDARARALTRRRELLVAEGRVGSAVLAARGLLEGGGR